MMASELNMTSIREDVRACAAPETHCSVLRNYRVSLDHPHVRTPILCDANADARVVFIGAIGGEITFHRPGQSVYEYNQLCGNEYTLGWRSGINLAKLLHRLYLRMPSLVRCNPGELRGSLDPHRLSTRDASGIDRFLRRFFSAEVMPVHRTNLLKCHGPDDYKEGKRNFREAATVCCDRHLARELQVLRPTIVVPLGNGATAFFVSWTRLRGPRAVRGWQAIPREQRRVFLPKLGIETIVNPYFHPSPRAWNRSTEADREAFVADLAWALGSEVGHPAVLESMNTSVHCAESERRVTRRVEWSSAGRRAEPVSIDRGDPWIRTFLNDMLTNWPTGTKVSRGNNGPYPGVRIRNGGKASVDCWAHDHYIRVGIHRVDEWIIRELQAFPEVDVELRAKSWITLYVRGPSGLAAIRWLAT